MTLEKDIFTHKYRISAVNAENMKQLENVTDTLVSSYFASKEDIQQKFPTNEISSENPFWDTDKNVASLSDICIKVE